MLHASGDLRLHSELTKSIHKHGMTTLAEVHAHYEVQIEIAKRVDYVYDFALPPLILFSIFSKTTTRLKQWYSVSPRNCLTVLDTHDGIVLWMFHLTMENQEFYLTKS